VPAAQYDLIVEQGATLPLNITWKAPNGTPINLTGFRVRAQIRETAESDSILLSFDSAALTAGMTIGALNSSGVIDITIAPSVTSTLSFGVAAWDLIVISPGGVVDRLVQGTATLIKTVTR